MKRHSHLANELKGDIKVAKKIRLPWWALLCVLIGSLLSCWFFDHFGRLNLVLPTANIIGVLSLAIAVKWELRRRAWFWLIMSIIAALHVPLILFVPWTDIWVPAAAFAGAASLDLVVVFVIFEAVGNFAEKSESAEN